MGGATVPRRKAQPAEPEEPKGPIEGEFTEGESDKHEPVEGNNGGASTVVMSTDEIEEALEETTSKEEYLAVKDHLQSLGVPRGTITAVTSMMKKKGKLQFLLDKHDDNSGAEEEMSTDLSTTKPLTVEALTRGLRIPIIPDGNKEVFDAGVNYGIRSIVVGVRLAQELSKMGIAQAMPIIRMSSEMRKAEGRSAEESGRVAAEEAYARAASYFASIPKSSADSPNPMQAMVVRAIEPVMQNMIQKMFGFPQLMQGGNPGTQQQPSNLPPGWTDESAVK
jgi:hypothetical protein